MCCSEHCTATRTCLGHATVRTDCCRVDFHTQTQGAGAKASQEAQQLTEAVGTVFDLQTGTLHGLRSSCTELQAKAQAMCCQDYEVGAWLTCGTPAKRVLPYLNLLGDTISCCE